MSVADSEFSVPDDAEFPLLDTILHASAALHREKLRERDIMAMCGDPDHEQDLRGLHSQDSFIEPDWLEGLEVGSVDEAVAMATPGEVAEMLVQVKKEQEDLQRLRDRSLQHSAKQSEKTLSLGFSAVATARQRERQGSLNRVSDSSQALGEIYSEEELKGRDDLLQSEHGAVALTWKENQKSEAFDEICKRRIMIREAVAMDNTKELVKPGSDIQKAIVNHARVLSQQEVAVADVRKSRDKAIQGQEAVRLKEERLRDMLEVRRQQLSRCERRELEAIQKVMDTKTKVKELFLALMQELNTYNDEFIQRKVLGIRKDRFKHSVAEIQKQCEKTASACSLAEVAFKDWEQTAEKNIAEASECAAASVAEIVSTIKPAVREEALNVAVASCMLRHLGREKQAEIVFLRDEMGNNARELEKLTGGRGSFNRSILVNKRGQLDDRRRELERQFKEANEKDGLFQEALDKAQNRWAELQSLDGIGPTFDENEVLAEAEEAARVYRPEFELWGRDSGNSFPTDPPGQCAALQVYGSIPENQAVATISQQMQQLQQLQQQVQQLQLELQHQKLDQLFRHRQAASEGGSDWALVGPASEPGDRASVAGEESTSELPALLALPAGDEAPAAGEVPAGREAPSAGEAPSAYGASEARAAGGAPAGQ